MKDVRRMTLVILVIVVLAQGCSSMMGTRGYSDTVSLTAVYADGVLEATYPNSVFKTSDAVRDALNDLNVAINSTKKDATSGIIMGTRSDGTKVNIDMKAQKPDVTLVNIKVGALGEEEFSRAISRKIETNLRK